MRLLILIFPVALAAQFDYDRAQPFDTGREELASRPGAKLWGDSFAGPNGGRINFVLVEPAPSVKPPYAGVIFQHGGGQSMTNYISEALILAERGVVSIIPDAPARGPGRNNDTTSMTPEQVRDHFAEIVVSERRVLDYLLRQPGVDPKRIAYVGHSYGGNTGAILAAIEPRIATFVLLGATAVRQESDRADLIAAMDPGRFLPRAKAPILVQCAKFDTDNNVRGCPEVNALAGGPKRLTWYDDDHNFTSFEAMLDRMYWLESKLSLKPVRPVIERFLKRP